MIDIIYLAHGRPEFTAASIAALTANTDWERARLVVYTDGCALSANLMGIPAVINEERHGGPITIMNHYLMKSKPADIFAKIDNDCVVPPEWLDRSLHVVATNPHLGLLGLEPPSSTVRLEACDIGAGYSACDSIGGIGVMRRKAFDGQDSMRPHSTYGGFTDWQLRHPEIVKGWITPPLSLFLLDRLPMEPWASLSKRYIAEGQQRPWRNYTADDAHLWSWWSGVAA